MNVTTEQVEDLLALALGGQAHDMGEVQAAPDCPPCDWILVNPRDFARFYQQGWDRGRLNLESSTAQLRLGNMGLWDGATLLANAQISLGDVFFLKEDKVLHARLLQ